MTHIPGGYLMRGAARFSDDGSKRYWLLREWDAALPHLVWMMLNPSKAGAEIGDHTITRCVNFTKRERVYGGIEVVNHIPLVATNPRAIFKQPGRLTTEASMDEGGINRRAVIEACRDKDVVFAWGANVGDLYCFKELAGRAYEVATSVRCLGLTLDGHPRHPLRLSGDTPLVVY